MFFAVHHVGLIVFRRMTLVAAGSIEAASTTWFIDSRLFWSGGTPEAHASTNPTAATVVVREEGGEGVWPKKRPHIFLKTVMFPTLFFICVFVDIIC